MSVRHLEEEVDAGHPLHEQIRVLAWVTPFPRIHSREMSVPMIYEFQGEREFPSLYETFIINSPITRIYIGRSRLLLVDIPA
mgnify:CR=1 FL=1